MCRAQETRRLVIQHTVWRWMAHTTIYMVTVHAESTCWSGEIFHADIRMGITCKNSWLDVNMQAVFHGLWLSGNGIGDMTYDTINVILDFKIYRWSNLKSWLYLKK